MNIAQIFVGGELPSSTARSIILRYALRLGFPTTMFCKDSRDWGPSGLSKIKFKSGDKKAVKNPTSELIIAYRAGHCTATESLFKMEAERRKKCPATTKRVGTQLEMLVDLRDWLSQVFNHTKPAG